MKLCQVQNAKINIVYRDNNLIQVKKDWIN